MFWYEEEIKRVESQVKITALDNVVLFYGSSSITLWKTLAHDFPHQPVVNLGFGGSTLAGCVWFFERVMHPYRPKSIVFYGGDNDLGDGRHPEEVLIFFQQLLFKVRKHFGNIPFAFISIKPSPRRWNIAEQIVFTNQLIEKELTQQTGNPIFINIYDAMLGSDGKPNQHYFETDGLHLSRSGYQLWQEIISKHTSFVF